MKRIVSYSVEIAADKTLIVASYYSWVFQHSIRHRHNMLRPVSVIKATGYKKQKKF